VVHGSVSSAGREVVGEVDGAGRVLVGLLLLSIGLAHGGSYLGVKKEFVL